MSAEALPTEEQIAAVEAEVQGLKATLLAPADAAFDFQPSLWKLDGRTEILHFRKLSYVELMQNQEGLVQIPPRFTTRPWQKEEWENLPKEMKDWWRQPRDATKDERDLMRKTRDAILALTNKDGKTAADFEKMGPAVVNECFDFVSTISGFSDDALELLDWFRQQQRRSGVRGDMSPEFRKATVRAFQAAQRLGASRPNVLRVPVVERTTGTQ